MKIDTVITSFTNNPTYLEFVVPTCIAWKKLNNIIPKVAYILCNNPEQDQLILSGIEKANSDYGNFIDLCVYPRIQSIDYGIQGKITRMFLAASLKDNFSLIADIDMIPLNSNLIDFANDVPEDHIIQFGYDHPSFREQINLGKWPMDKTIASGKTFSDIVNPKNLEYEELLTSWRGFPEDSRTNVFNNFSNFSDESLLKCLYNRWEHKNTRTTKIKRHEVSVKCKCKPNELYGRLYKQAHPTTENLDMSNYYEVHGPRPNSSNQSWYKPVIDYINKL